MGITGELVRNVFSKNRSIQSHDTNVRSNTVDKKRWSSVRSYLCGDEFNSVLAEKESASVQNSEITVTQSAIEQQVMHTQTEKQNSIPVLFREEDAAISIQSAFRDFLERRRNERMKMMDCKGEPVVGKDSPSKESMATSLEGQTGNSVQIFSCGNENLSTQFQMQQKPRNHVLRLKEDWDDSTVSSNISKLRIQTRLEATTRRERALAYAFSQQLRICSKKKQTRSDGTNANMGWNWLERWMATRLPENSWSENGCQEFSFQNRFFDFAGEEKESCGSNEVPVRFDGFRANADKEKDGIRPIRNRLKATRNVSRPKTMPSYKVPRAMQHCSGELGKGKRQKDTRVGSAKEIEYKSGCE